MFSSWRGILSAFFSPAFLLLIGIYGLSNGGFRFIPTFAFGLGLFLALVVVLDYPLKSRFGPEGIDRICLLRVHHIGWSRVRAISRSPGSTWAQIRRPGFFRSGGAPTHQERERRPAAFGGLAAQVGNRRRYLLANQVEGRQEFDELVRKLPFWSTTTYMRAQRPPESATPSSLYRRKGAL